MLSLASIGLRSVCSPSIPRISISIRRAIDEIGTSLAFPSNGFEEFSPTFSIETKIHIALPVALVAVASLVRSSDARPGVSRWIALLGLATLAMPAPAAVVVAIGPEGGWSPRDRELLHGHGFTGLRLGPRVLRTETAGLAAIAALQARFGDLG